MATKDDEIKKLNDYTHIRLRTEMYLNSRQPHTQEYIIYDENHRPIIKELTIINALYCMYREVLDNALDEISHGYGNRINITFDKESFEFSVEDEGRGIPLKPVSKTDATPIATMVLTNARAGRNFGERGQTVGTNGIGVFASVAVSSQAKVEIRRDKKLFTQAFAEHDTELMIEMPKIKRDKNIKTGTKITVTPSEKVFHSGLIMPEEFLYSRIFDIALANPTIQVFYNGKRIRVRPASEKTLFPENGTILFDIKENQFRSKFILKPDFREKGEMVHSIVNNIPAFDGGTHIEAFKKYFYSGLLNAMAPQAKRRKLTPNRNDVNEGLFIYNITTMNAPDFNSQSKTKLINEDVGKIVKLYFDDEKIFKDIIRKHPEWVESIFERCANRTQKKDNKDVARLSKQNLRGRVPDLLDAAGKIRRNCILILGEGDSAVSGIPPVRDPEIHGILGIQGKIMNVNGEAPRKVVDSATLSSLMTAIGLVIGQEADRKAMNYGKIYFATDADPDGLNIAALLTNFFYSYWPELFDASKDPVFYVFNTPFVIARKGKQNKYWYSHNYDDFEPAKYKGWEITRAKGLAALEEDDWIYSLKNPDLYAIVEDGEMKESLDLIFNGDRADDRKEWIGL